MATEQTVLEQIEDALMLKPNSLTIDSEAKDFKEWDSMGTMNILIWLDSDFNLKLAPGETDSLQSTRGIIQLLKSAGKLE